MHTIVILLQIYWKNEDNSADNKQLILDNCCTSKCIFQSFHIQHVRNPGVFKERVFVSQLDQNHDREARSASEEEVSIIYFGIHLIKLDLILFLKFIAFCALNLVIKTKLF